MGADREGATSEVGDCVKRPGKGAQQPRDAAARQAQSSTRSSCGRQSRRSFGGVSDGSGWGEQCAREASRRGVEDRAKSCVPPAGERLISCRNFLERARKAGRKGRRSDCESGWSGAIAPPSSRFQQRLRECSRTATRHDGHPPTEPCCPGTRFGWTVRAFALASCPKNACISADHLPPTSKARTTSFAPPSQLGIHSPFFVWRGRGKPSHPGDTNVVSTTSCAREKQRKSVSNHLESATVRTTLRQPNPSHEPRYYCPPWLLPHRRPNTPASTQAARWCQRRPGDDHTRQFREDGDETKTRNCVESSRANVLVGNNNNGPP